MKTQVLLSKNTKRNKSYLAFLETHQDHIKVMKVAELGCYWMRQEKIHAHFFGHRSLLKTSLYLAFFALRLPYEYDNPQYLNKSITQKEAMAIIALFERKIDQRIPVEYITEESFYLGNKFYVNENV